MNKDVRKLHKEFLSVMHKYRQKFGFSFMPEENVLRDYDNLKSFIDLMEKSINEGVNYSAKEAGIDVAAYTRKTKVFID